MALTCVIEGCSRDAEAWSNYCQLHRQESRREGFGYRHGDYPAPPDSVDPVMTIIKDPDSDEGSM
jgi:hypothetical protein